MIDPAAAAGELQAIADDVSHRLDTFLASRDDEAPALIDRASAMLVETMASAPPGMREGIEAAERVLPLVTDAAGEAPLHFWSTHLGRLVARHIGTGGEAATRQEVAAILGFTRQRVHQMVTSGPLREHPDGGVDNASLVRHFALTAPPL